MSQVIALGPAARMLTTREAAVRLGVSLRTVQLWVEASILPAARTPGGHRRIPYNAVEALAMSMGLADAQPASAVASATDPVALTPLHDGDAEAMEPSAEAPPRPLKLLVVSRESDWLRQCASALEVFGDSVDLHLADNGYVALLMIGRESPDLLITTLELPGLDGLEMIRTLERCEVLPRLNVLALLPLANERPGLAESLPAGVDVMHLPVSPEALAIRAGRWLLSRRNAQGVHHE